MSASLDDLRGKENNLDLNIFTCAFKERAVSDCVPALLRDAGIDRFVFPSLALPCLSSLFTL